MNFTELITYLRSRIEETLIPIINNKCVLFDIPYYTNIGDVLIWQGTEDFMKKNKIDCLYRTSNSNFKFMKLPSDTVILLQGGGNFGDLWRKHQDFRLKIIELYPNNPIIILPQTLYYENENVMIADAELMNKHKNLYICARDLLSFNLLNNYFVNSTNYLLPDMAYCISTNTLDRYRKISDPNLALYLRRTDKEVSHLTVSDDIFKAEFRRIDVRDWPEMENMSNHMKLYYKFAWLNRRCCGMFSGLLDSYMFNNVRPFLVRQGVEFVSGYTTIYTTRLHVAILSSLLGKPFTFLNNSYGKNVQFYNAWLSKCEGIIMLEK